MASTPSSHSRRALTAALDLALGRLLLRRGIGLELALQLLRRIFHALDELLLVVMDRVLLDQRRLVVRPEFYDGLGYVGPRQIETAQHLLGEPQARVIGLAHEIRDTE